jgi:steroid delta-isomerase-like uncharacterized protein
MSDANKAVVRRLIDEVNKRNLGIIDELISDDYSNNDRFGSEAPGRQGVKDTLALFLRAFPDLHETTVELVAEGDKVVHRWTSRATHRGEFRGIAPTNRQVNMKGIEVFRIRDGKVTERWGLADSLGLLQQLGATLNTGPA